VIAVGFDPAHTIASRVRELGLHADSFWAAQVAILDRHVFKAVTARLAGAEGWTVVERVVVCVLAVTDEGDDVLIGVVPWKPSEDDSAGEVYAYPQEARERHERRFLAEAGYVLRLYPHVLAESVLFCVGGLVPEAREGALVELGIGAAGARELIELWEETGS
jgi:hypothetical protein